MHWNLWGLSHLSQAKFLIYNQIVGHVADQHLAVTISAQTLDTDFHEKHFEFLTTTAIASYRRELIIIRIYMQ